MTKLKVDKKALRRSFWGSISRLLGIVMASGSGSIISQTIGQSSSWTWPLGVGMAIAGFILIMYAEYEREVEHGE